MHHAFAVNHFALFATAAIQWAIGALWYGVFFRNSWKKLLGGAEAPTGGRAVFALACSFVASLILCFVLVHIIMWAGAPTFRTGAALAIICWLGLMAPPLFTQHIYEKRPVNLFAINAVYWMLAMGVSGGVLAVWR